MGSRGIGVEFAHIAYTMVVNTGICLLLLLLAYGKVANLAGYILQFNATDCETEVVMNGREFVDSGMKLIHINPFSSSFSITGQCQAS